MINVLLRVLIMILVHLRGAVVQSVYRLTTGWTTDGSGFLSQKGEESSLLLAVQTGAWVHLALLSNVPGALFPAVKRPGNEADNSPPTNAEVKKTSMSLLRVSSWSSA
jgi:hypothetical protein